MFRRLCVNSLIFINSGRFFFLKTSNFTTFHPVSQVDNSCRIISSRFYREITVDSQKTCLIEKNHHRYGKTIFNKLIM